MPVASHRTESLTTMFEKLDRSSGPVYGLRVSGTVTEDDYRHIEPELDRLIAEHGAVDLLLHFDGLTGMQPEALWADLRFDMRHLRDVRRMAVVKERDWQGWLARLSGPLAGIETRVFDRAEEAWTWLETRAEEAAARRHPRDLARAHHTRLRSLVDALRRDLDGLDDPRAEALFETAAETLGGLSDAFAHYERRAEEAWRED